MFDVRQYILESLRSGTFYNSHGKEYILKEFIETEVEERGNFSLKEVKHWMQKYHLTPRSRCIWVTPSLSQARRHAGYYAPKDDLAVYRVPQDGFLIPESDDGDEGYLLILK